MISVLVIIIAANHCIIRAHNGLFFFFSPSVFSDWCQVIGWAPITFFVSRTTKRRPQSWKAPTGSSIQWNPSVSGPQGSNKQVGKTGSWPFIPLIIVFFPPLWEWLNWSASTMAGYETLAIWQEKAGYETQWVTWQNHGNNQDWYFDPFLFLSTGWRKAKIWNFFPQCSVP